MEERSVKSGRNSGLDILKGLAILFVIITHMNWSGEQRATFLFPFWIEMAVPLFMLVSGYLYAASYHKRGGVTLAGLRKYIPANLLRFLVPYLIAFLIEAVFFFAYSFLTHEPIAAAEYLFQFLRGGWGPGSYYIPILMQFVFLFPIIYMIVSHYKEKGLLACLALNVFYEVVRTAYYFSEDTYRLLVFRYIFIIALGCYLFLIKDKPLPVFILPMGILGFAFIFVTQYLSYSPILFTFWTSTCMISSLWAIPAFVLFTRKLNKLNIPFLELLGKRSFAIYLTQMVWYGCGGRKLLAMITHDSLIIEFIVCLVVCCGAGIVFHHISSWATNLLLTRLPKAD